MFMWYPVYSISSFWTQKNENAKNKNFRKFFLHVQKEKTKNLWTPRILKVPQPKNRSVSEMNKYQEMVVSIK